MKIEGVYLADGGQCSITVNGAEVKFLRRRDRIEVFSVQDHETKFEVDLK